MRTLVHAFETWRTPKLLGAAALSVFVPLAATLLTPPVIDLVLGVVSLGALVGTGVGWRHRTKVASLPLELAPAAARGMCRGVPVFRFRVWLGHGREMTVERAAVRYVCGAQSIELEPEFGPGSRVVGPLTLLLRDVEGCCSGGGRFEVDVQVREGDTLWAASATYAEDELVTGRFREGLVLSGGLQLEPGNFGTISD